MKEVQIEMSADDWMKVGAAVERMGVDLNEFTRQAITIFSQQVLILPKPNAKLQEA